ncbi:hypothetical protein CBM2589_B10301 [Cupriavidus taiwanensis]|uniref:Uncharacterized protein n=1 Tax=Cupriavidus taiwanensis TaxID=164546 RepID=A0A375B8T9_9BURK|nr:hypothetical protein CBM2589_B10301 [Cupriavidus taiwanensis]
MFHAQASAEHLRQAVFVATHRL